MLNRFAEVDWNPDVRARRKFAASLIIGFPVKAIGFSLITFLAKHSWKPFFLWVGIIGIAAGIIFWLLPQIAKPFYIALYFMARWMGRVGGKKFFALCFNLCFTQLAL